MSFKENSSQQMALADSFLNLTERERKLLDISRKGRNRARIQCTMKEEVYKDSAYEIKIYHKI